MITADYYLGSVIRLSLTFNLYERSAASPINWICETVYFTKDFGLFCYFYPYLLTSHSFTKIYTKISAILNKNICSD